MFCIQNLIVDHRPGWPPSVCPLPHHPSPPPGVSPPRPDKVTTTLSPPGVPPPPLSPTPTTSVSPSWTLFVLARSHRCHFDTQSRYLIAVKVNNFMKIKSSECALRRKIGICGACNVVAFSPKEPWLIIGVLNLVFFY